MNFLASLLRTIDLISADMLGNGMTVNDYNPRYL